jgi:tetratricopeptide (TPR) repeat protein
LDDIINKTFKPSYALKYLEKALEIVETLGTQPEILEIKANIFLNLSSVHSLKGQHDIALNYCSKSIQIFTDLYNKIVLKREATDQCSQEYDSKVGIILIQIALLRHKRDERKEPHFI